MKLANLNKIMNEWGKYIVQQSRTRLTKGKQNISNELYRSLKYKIAESKNKHKRFNRNARLWEVSR